MSYFFYFKRHLLQIIHLFGDGTLFDHPLMHSNKFYNN